MEQTFGFQMKNGDTLRVSAENLTDAMSEVLDMLGVTLVSGKLSPRPTASEFPITANVLTPNFGGRA
ncbi:hypothetical protein [Achromobacter sp. AGC39]